MRNKHCYSRLFSLILLLCAYLLAGCTAPSVYVQADQSRKDALFAPKGIVAEYQLNHPEQAQTWADFGTAWQMDIDAQKSTRPWWLGGTSPAK